MTELIKNRKWTKGLINKFYPVPDVIKLYSRYKKGQLIKLYNIYKVIEIENSKEFKIEFNKLKNKRRILSEKMKKINEIKLQNTLDFIESINLKIVKIEDKKSLYNLALNNYNRLNPKKKLLVLEDVSEEFIKRITINYLRHNFTKYHKYLFKIDNAKNMVGRKLAYKRLRYKINKLIFETYPYLKN